MWCEAMEEPVVCLLDRLKCPREQINPCKEVKRSTGATSFEPQKVFFLINDQHLSTNKGKLFCDECREFLS